MLIIKLHSNGFVVYMLEDIATFMYFSIVMLLILTRNSLVSILLLMIKAFEVVSLMA